METELKKRRKNQGLTQVKIARDVDITERMYQRYEAGVEPKVRTAIRIAKALGTTVEQLFKDTKKA